MKALTLQRIEIFKLVYETGSITEAARRLGLAQPTVSRHLGYFEQSLALSLFINERGRLKPTWEAHRLYKDCSDMFDGMRQIEKTVRLLQTGEQEHFRVMVVPSMVNMPIMAEALRVVLRKKPKLKISVDVGISATQIDGIQDGSVDFGVVGHVAPTSSVRMHEIGKSDIVALVHPDHDLADRPSIRLEDFQDHPYVAMAPSGAIGNMIQSLFDERMLAPNVLVELMAPSLVPSVTWSLKSCAMVDSLTAHYIARPLGLMIKHLKPTISFGLHTLHRDDTPLRQIGDIIQHELTKQLHQHGL